MNQNRRQFLKNSALAFTALSASRVLGANDQIRAAFIGLGERGMQTAKQFAALPGVRITHLCDADTAAMDRAKQVYPGAKTEQDLRKVVELPDVDVVVISTGNHWHALAAIWAIQAGKDVYVEKPVSHNIWEGRKIVEAARKHNRMVQGGTQQRSDPFHAEMMAFMDTKPVGESKYVRCNHYSVRQSIGKRTTPLKPPTTVDYDLWLGPAKDIPIMREKFHYDWHWVWNTGNGELGNWGPHILDDLRNVVFRDKVTLPKRVLAGGGRLAWHDAGETPNTHFVYLDTGVLPVIVDVHNLPVKKGVNAPDVYLKRRTRAFLIIECEGGYYAGGRGGGAVYDSDGKVIKKFAGDSGEGHARNFIEGVRSRKPEHLNGEIEKIHLSSAWCHLGNLSWQLGQPYDADKAKTALAGFEPWQEVLGDFDKHLAVNEINPADENIKLGALLEIDPEKEALAASSATPEATALWNGSYRKGFELPQEV